MSAEQRFVRAGEVRHIEASIYYTIHSQLVIIKSPGELHINDMRWVQAATLEFPCIAQGVWLALEGISEDRKFGFTLQCSAAGVYCLQGGRWKQASDRIELYRPGVWYRFQFLGHSDSILLLNISYSPPYAEEGVVEQFIVSTVEG